jgi:prepilin-type N-terminal cleavage/methylation domain-containing protein
MKKMTTRGRRGFTLLELLIVIVILFLVIAGVGIGAYFLIKALFFSQTAASAMLSLPACIA